jgi:hypothetical protein
VEGSFRKSCSPRRTEAPKPSDYDIRAEGQKTCQTLEQRDWSLFAVRDAICQIGGCDIRHHSVAQVELPHQSLGSATSLSEETVQTHLDIPRGLACSIFPSPSLAARSSHPLRQYDCPYRKATSIESDYMPKPYGLLVSAGQVVP